MAMHAGLTLHPQLLIKLVLELIREDSLIETIEYLIDNIYIYY